MASWFRLYDKVKAVSGAARWDERIARARTLAATRPAAAEALTFYAALAEYQKSLVTYVARPGLGAATPLSPGSSRSFIEALDLDSVLAAIPDFLAWLPRVAPTRLAESVAVMRTLDREQWRHFLQSCLAGKGPDLANDGQTLVFVVEALLQPFAEQAATHAAPFPQERSSARCPVCGALPVVGALREEGQGAKRTLVCALCLTEREYLRVVCPGCGEQQFDILPVYTASIQRFPQSPAAGTGLSEQALSPPERDELLTARIEACDRCHCYLKTIDLTKDGLAVPLVDDIASVSLDLWARERGYLRLRANILGF